MPASWIRRQVDQAGCRPSCETAFYGRSAVAKGDGRGRQRVPERVRGRLLHDMRGQHASDDTWSTNSCRGFTVIDVRPPYPQGTRPEVCCVAWHARDAALKLVHACQHRAAPPVTILPHVLRTPSLHLTARHPHTPLWLTDAMSRAQAPRQLLLLAQARPARLGHVPRAQELLVGGPIEPIRTPHRCAHREPREPLTGVGGRPQPCLARPRQLPLSRSHARTRAAA